MALTIGFIGTGGIANQHFINLSQMGEDLRLAAFCDVDEARARDAAKRFQGAAYTDYRRMLDAERLDAVYIPVPPFAHQGQELELAQRRIPFFVEKPIATRLEYAREVEQAVREAGLLTSVGYHWRYWNYAEMAKERLRGKTIGMALGYWMGDMPSVAWWRRQEMSGGQLVEQTTHAMDLARYLCGEIVEVFALMANQASREVPECSVADVGTMTARFASGAIGTFSNTCMLQGFGYTVGLHVVTPESVVEVDSHFFRTIERGREETIRGGNNAYLEEDRAFVQALKSGGAGDFRSPYADEVKTLAVTLAANESAEAGRPISL